MKRTQDNQMGMKLTRRAALLAGVSAMVSAAAAATDWDAVVKAANAEGEVLLYSTKADNENTDLVSAFMKKYPGIRTKVLRIVGSAVATKVDQELQSGALAVDVIVHAELQWAAAKAKAGRFLIPNGPSVALWKGAERYYDQGVVQLTAEPWVIGYNTKAVTEHPTDWDTLLGNDRYRGRVGLNEVNGLTIGIWYDFIAQKKPGYFERLARLNPQLYPTSAPLVAGLSSGEIAWAPYSLASTIEPLKAKGAPIAYALPASGTWPLVRSGMVFKEVPHPNAALVFLDFMMGQDGQQILNSNHAGYSVAPGVTVKGGAEVDLTKISDIDYTSYDPALVRTWQNKVDQLFRH